jgi:glycosyltransferase involved in cell wall biosynthesis
MTGLRKTVIGAVYPHAAGVAQFNGAMVRAMSATSPVDVISWRRMYPPFLHRGQDLDTSSTGAVAPPASFILDWHDPRTWRRAVRRVEDFGSQAVILPWLHAVMAPPYRSMLRGFARSTTRVVICHNVVPHESLPGLGRLTQAALRNADLIVIHAPHQRDELAAVGLGSTPILEAFHPRFDTVQLAPLPPLDVCVAERARHGNPDLLLLTFGSIRPYKGVDIALDALTLVDPQLHVRVIVAGRSWGEQSNLKDQVQARGLEGKVEIRNRFIPNEEAALLFGAADASLLPYRSASQSGVVQLSFGYGRPVIATRVGGLPAAVEHGVDGLLCEPTAEDIADAIEAMAENHESLAAGVRAGADANSFRCYSELLDGAVRSIS